MIGGSKDFTAAKRVRAPDTPIPSSLIVNFVDGDGNRAGSPVDIPVSSTVKQLELLLNTLLRKETTPVPYAFYVNNIEVTNSMVETLIQIQQLKEDTNSTNAAKKPEKIDKKTKKDVSSNADEEPQQPESNNDDTANVVQDFLTFEDTVTISYQPLSVFRVRPVTRCVETMPGHTDAVLHVSYSPDGKKLASGGGDLAVLELWTPDAKLFISADRSGEIRMWDPNSGKSVGQAMKGHKKWITSLCCEPLHADPTCTRLATASKDTTVKIWNLRTCLCETTISGHLDSVESVKWGGTGLLYTASRDRTIKVWAVDGSGRSQHKLVRTLSGHAHRVNTLALNCDYVLRTGAFQLGTVAMKRYTDIVGSNGDGERLISGSDDFTMFLWSPQVDKVALTRMVGHQQLINHIAFSPDGRYIASGSFDKKVKLCASKDSTLKIWAVKDTKKAVNTLAGHEDEVYTLDWSPSGTHLASGSKDRTIKIWHH
eukprot:gene33268-43016_t